MAVEDLELHAREVPALPRVEDTLLHPLLDAERALVRDLPVASFSDVNTIMFTPAYCLDVKARDGKSPRAYATVEMLGACNSCARREGGKGSVARAAADAGWTHFITASDWRSVMVCSVATRGGRTRVEVMMGMGVARSRPFARVVRRGGVRSRAARAPLRVAGLPRLQHDDLGVRGAFAAAVVMTEGGGGGRAGSARAHLKFDFGIFPLLRTTTRTHGTAPLTNTNRHQSHTCHAPDLPSDGRTMGPSDAAQCGPAPSACVVRGLL